MLELDLFAFSKSIQTMIRNWNPQAYEHTTGKHEHTFLTAETPTPFHTKLISENVRSISERRIHPKLHSNLHGYNAERY